jgi:ketosteroid isomerase-like protein
MTNKATLPTLDKLRSKVPANVDASEVARQWLESFASHVRSADIDGIIDLFTEDAYFRDVLALTWDFRTFEGTHAIKKFLEDRLSEAKPSSFKLKDDFLDLVQPYPDIAWIQALFGFETNVGLCSGVLRLVPMADGRWKAYTMFTNLEDLKGFPEKTGALRNHEPNHGKWAEKRKREVEFEDAEPTVLIVGGGQSGLELAARLKFLDVPTLVVERQPRVGDQWRKRYAALCLHDPVCKYFSRLCGLGLLMTPMNCRVRSHAVYTVSCLLSFMCLAERYYLTGRFPASWPVYTPALKVDSRILQCNGCR